MAREFVERIVGAFDSERGCGSIWSAEEFNQFTPRPLSEEEIQSVRALRSELFRKWKLVEAGQALELSF